MLDAVHKSYVQKKVALFTEQLKRGIYKRRHEVNGGCTTSCIKNQDLVMYSGNLIEIIDEENKNNVTKRLYVQQFFIPI